MLKEDSENNGGTILMVGFLCYDLIFTTPQYPEEDSMNRALYYHKRRGGNASNSCTVLSQLGAKCELLAPMTSDEYAEFMKHDLRKNGILFENCPIHLGYDSPFTAIILSQASGTRTIVHYRKENFPEYTVDDFLKLNLADYKWIHFEGRSIHETLKMISELDKYNAERKHQPIPYSVELEKCSEKTKDLIPTGDYVFVAKEFAKFLGYLDPIATLHGLASKVKPGAVIIVPWGQEGAVARCKNGDIVKSKAFSPAAVLDTLGAGDTFIAATVFYLSKQKSVLESINFGNRIAGAKCGMMGYDGIKSEYNQLQKK